MVWSHKGKGSKRGENRRSEWERKILCKGGGEEEHRGASAKEQVMFHSVVEKRCKMWSSMEWSLST